ncbi:ribosomal protein S18-alanine N-acetyltransferase [Succinivibrio sp.]|uniref:ribosomal protein S18-alanine N-acetyltransferase n=1 Tax=Succinivibrio sp. TaxID=2053619 RepID=UPI0025FE77AD|nr:ribosomal protein S18-alanine N-acetyltransferase [Succinivibrio sp.]MBQ9220378.1 ribosomal protein S18-alanine N-acetyltransferase [Succinivibrio sp.]
MANNPFYTRILSREDLSLVKSMEKIEFRTQKNAWNAQSLIECFDDSYLIIGLFNSQSLIGFSVIYNTKFTTDLLTIGVDPDFQGKKLGSLLLRDTLMIALNNQVQECFLEVRVSNIVAQNLYKKYGFKIVGTRPSYYNPVGNSPAEDAYTMHLCDIKENLDKTLAL